MGVTKEEMLDAIGKPIIESFDAEGITQRYLAKKLKKELNAKKTEQFKGKIIEDELGDQGKVTKRIEQEVVIYSKPLIAWDIRQKARQDAHKLRGDYPPEKSEYSGPGGSPIPVKLYDFDDSKFPKSKTEDGNGEK